MQRRHPFRRAEAEAEHLREVGEEGESPETPVIVVGTVLAIVVPLAAALIFVGFAVSHFA
jgi:hypothetical protein